MTRILHLTRDFPPRHCGGISTAVGGLVPALEKAGVACAVASFDDYRPAAGKRRAPDRTEPTNAQGLLRIDDEHDLQQLPAFARAFAPDVIQLHVDLLWAIADDLRRQLEVPIVTTLHVCHRAMLRVVGAERESASLAAQEQALAAAELIVAPSQAAAETILGDYPQIERRLRVAGFTVETKRSADLEAPRLTTVGRFGRVKGTDRLIELLPQLLAEPELTVEVVGGLPRSPRRDRRWRESLLEAAGPHRDRLQLHGWLDPNERDAVLARSRALLSVSRIESFGLAALEALAHGVPVCGYSEPALVETAPGQLWLPDGEPSAVLELLADPARCRELGRAGREAIRPWSAVVDEWRAAYSAL